MTRSLRHDPDHIVLGHTVGLRSVSDRMPRHLEHVLDYLYDPRNLPTTFGDVWIGANLVALPQADWNYGDEKIWWREPCT